MHLGSICSAAAYPFHSISQQSIQPQLETGIALGQRGMSIINSYPGVSDPLPCLTEKNFTKIQMVNKSNFIMRKET